MFLIFLQKIFAPMIFSYTRTLLKRKEYCNNNIANYMMLTPMSFAVMSVPTQLILTNVDTLIFC